MRDQGREEWGAEGKKRGDREEKRKGKERGEIQTIPALSVSTEADTGFCLSATGLCTPAHPDPNLAMCPGKITCNGRAKRLR